MILHALQWDPSPVSGTLGAPALLVQHVVWLCIPGMSVLALPADFRLVVFIPARQALATQGRGMIVQTIEHALRSGANLVQPFLSLCQPAYHPSPGGSQQ